MCTALVILHPGFEEIEAVTPIDLLRRAGVMVTIVAIDSPGPIEGKSGLQILTTQSLAAVQDEAFDAVVLPGGPGVAKLRQHAVLCRRLQTQAAAGKWIACICAAPLLLLDAGLLEGRNYTAFPATKDELPEATAANVVVDGMIITSRGAGTAHEFALTLITALQGETASQAIADSICWPHAINRS